MSWCSCSGSFLCWASQQVGGLEIFRKGRGFPPGGIFLFVEIVPRGVNKSHTSQGDLCSYIFHHYPGRFLPRALFKISSCGPHTQKVVDEANGQRAGQQWEGGSDTGKRKESSSSWGSLAAGARKQWKAGGYPAGADATPTRTLRSSCKRG